MPVALESWYPVVFRASLAYNILVIISGQRGPNRRNRSLQKKPEKLFIPGIVPESREIAFVAPGLPASVIRWTAAL